MSNKMSTSGDVPLAAAAFQLGLTREMTLRRLMRRELLGRQLPNGRWVVDRRSLERALRDGAASRTAPPQAGVHASAGVQ